MDKTSSVNKFRVMMVEPDEFLRDIYSKKFKDVGFDFLGLSYVGDDFLDKVAEWKPDLISLGVILYKHIGENQTEATLDGFQVIQLLKQDSRTNKIPVFFLTNLGQPEDINKGMSLGAAGYLVAAEVTPNDVITIFTKHLNEHTQ